MRTIHRRLAISLATLAVAAPAAAQMFQASGFATVNVAGLGNTTTVAGESRIPILPHDVSFDTSASALHVRATGHRGAVRQVDIDVQGAHPGGHYEVTASSGTTLRVRMESGAELTAQSGHGNISITDLNAQRVTGTYEGTFAHGAVPVVIRGHFEANFPRARADAGTGSGS